MPIYFYLIAINYKNWSKKQTVDDDKQKAEFNRWKDAWVPQTQPVHLCYFFPPVNSRVKFYFDKLRLHAFSWFSSVPEQYWVGNEIPRCTDCLSCSLANINIEIPPQSNYLLILKCLQIPPSQGDCENPGFSSSAVGLCSYPLNIQIFISLSSILPNALLSLQPTLIRRTKGHCLRTFIAANVCFPH
jgi:hypothetical protein